MPVSPLCNFEGTDYVFFFVSLMLDIHSLILLFFPLFIQQTFIVFITHNELDKAQRALWKKLFLPLWYLPSSGDKTKPTDNYSNPIRDIGTRSCRNG